MPGLCRNAKEELEKLAMTNIFFITDALCGERPVTGGFP